MSGGRPGARGARDVTRWRIQPPACLVISRSRCHPPFPAARLRDGSPQLRRQFPAARRILGEPVRLDVARQRKGVLRERERNHRGKVPV